MEHAAKTHIGLVRRINEDEYSLLTDLGTFRVAIVADGMGGALAGEIASSIAVEVVSRELRSRLAGKSIEEVSYDLSDFLVEAILKANEEIFQRGNSASSMSGMGTTIVVSVVTEDNVTMAFIGDSRGYLIGRDYIKQLTDDHSLVNELYKHGQLTEEEVTSHPQRNIITRAVGTEGAVQVDLISTSWQTGQIVLLCTDGLTDLVSNEEIMQIVNEEGTLPEKVDKLIQKALDGGGNDNITVVALQNMGGEKRGDAE
jgi:protein phosphatase